MRIILVLSLVALAACGSDGNRGDGGRLQVVAGFYPLAEAARQVGGDRVEVTDLTPAGLEPHDLELDAGAVDDVLDADVVLLLGQGFQPAVEDIAPDDTVEILTQPTDDPHVWLDPTQMADIAERVADAVDGSADAYVAQLEELDAEFEAGLADCDRRVVVTAHEAFGWLAARYDLRQEGVAGISPTQEPDPRRLAELADLVEAEGVTTIFTEELVSPAVAETLARETGVRTAVLNPLESEPADGDYLSAMRGNLDTLREALGCR